MEHFMLGIVVAMVIIAGTYVVKAPIDALINNLNAVLDKDDQKTLSKLIKFKVHRIVPFTLILLIFLVGYWCGAVLQ